MDELNDSCFLCGADRENDYAELDVFELDPTCVPLICIPCIDEILEQRWKENQNKD